MKENKPGKSDMNGKLLILRDYGNKSRKMGL